MFRRRHKVDGFRFAVRFALVCLLTSACGQNDSPIAYFEHWVIDPQPNTGGDCCTDVLAVGDINGDGTLDVVIGSQEAKEAGLVWYRFPTWEKHPVAHGEFTTDGQTADVDGDGDLDIVIGTHAQGRGEIFWFENRDGRGARWARHAVGAGYAHDVEVGDVNADGRLDIVTCDKKRLTLWLQTAGGAFKGEIVLERQGEGTALADIDRDGDLDIVFGASWLENPGPGPVQRWTPRPIANEWPADTRVAVADMNADARPDVVLSVSEGEGPVSWFESPVDPRVDSWTPHAIEPRDLEGAHSLQVADFDADGDPDVLVAEMHTSRNKRVLLYRKDAGGFTPAILSRGGSHNMRVADLDGDGDSDIVGKNYAGARRPVEMWENLTSGASKWRYTAIDRMRPSSQQGKMGLVFADVDRDGLPDVIAGAFWYRNPGSVSYPEWVRRLVADEGMDVFFASDVDGDDHCDLIGIKDSTIYWVEATDAKATAWTARPVGEIAQGGRTQGYVTARLAARERARFVFTRGKNLYALEVPDDPNAAPWPLDRISMEVEEEGIGAGDLDRDGDLDLAAVSADGHHVVWLENARAVSEQWTTHTIGEPVDSQVWVDRIAVADVNGDERLDVLATEERQDWKGEAHLYWFEAPADPEGGKWTRHVIARHRSLNSMDVADVDGDGAPDVSVAEHTDQKDEVAQDNLSMIYLNKEKAGTWLPVVVDRGPRSSHLGARLVDLDHDGGFEIVSIGWNQYQRVHLWKKVAP